MVVVAYIGFGVSVREYHIPYIEGRNDIKVKYVYRREEDIEQNAVYEPFYPEIEFTTDLEQVLNDSEVNLVVVNTPDQFHVPYAKKILQAGKNALIEKPFAPTEKEAHEVFALAKEKRLVCMANQNRRYDAKFLALKEVLESGKIGTPVRLEAHYDYFKINGWYDHLGTLYNLGVHTIDQMISLFGKPEKITYDVRSIHHPISGDDYYDIDFYYGNFKVTISTSMCVAIDYPSFTLHGTNGSFTLPPVTHNSGKKKQIGRHIISKENAPESEWGTLVYYENGEKIVEKIQVGCARYERIYDSLVAAIERGEEKVVRDEEVETVLEILEAATRTAEESQEKWGNR